MSYIKPYIKLKWIVDNKEYWDIETKLSRKRKINMHINGSQSIIMTIIVDSNEYVKLPHSNEDITFPIPITKEIKKKINIHQAKKILNKYNWQGIF